jgi:hypothetical protein
MCHITELCDCTLYYIAQSYKMMDVNNICILYYMNLYAIIHL